MERDYSNLIVVKLSMSKWNPKITDERVNKKVQSDFHTTNDAGRWEKNLIAKEAVKTYQRIAGDIDTWHRKNTMAHPERGLALVTVRHLEQVYKPGLEAWMTKFKEAYEGFIENYPAYREQAKADLGDTWREADYPKMDELRSKFAIGVRYYPFPTSEHLIGKMRSDIRAELKAELDRNNEEIHNLFLRDLWDRFHAAVAHIVERLKGADKVFKDTLVGNVRELCEIMKTLNPNGDTKLETMRAKLEQKIAGIDPEALRDDRKVRTQTFRIAESLLAEIETERRKISI